ncbi:hypothetical protein [Aurantiacibacter spongiae]|uniref:Uncharacterized protein n=1 Tax=Aurantiacibacter spongiae TaxID=2488860 RepID=A0A3N5D787_9SPHN|nr:hypothetical protein [Aurantiacibacter spongiae]RPF70378.1 hypothetical protein EG799_01080 [Aurantiacibacter spongiae]
MLSRRNRKLARYLTSIGSLGLIAGAATAYLHHATTGQILMGIGGVMLVLGAQLLANSPTGDDDARR